MDALLELAEFVFLAEHGGFSLPGVVRVELGFADHGGLVDPVAGDRLGEYIVGGLVVFDDDVGVVAVSSSGHGGVDTPTVCWGVDQEKGSVDGSSLGGVAGLGVAEFEILGHIVGWEPDGAGAAGER